MSRRHVVDANAAGQDQRAAAQLGILTPAELIWYLDRLSDEETAELTAASANPGDAANEAEGLEHMRRVTRWLRKRFPKP